MSNIFYIADLHFWHKNIMEYAPERGKFSCVEEHNELLIENINAVVGKRDVLYVLGDVWFGTKAKMPETLGRLQGKLRLVPGNHDHKLLPHLATYFDIQVGAVPHTLTLSDGRKIPTVLSHVPLHPDCLDRWSYNLHGHTHAKIVRQPDGRPDNRYLPFSAEHTHMKPVPQHDVILVIEFDIELKALLN